MGGFESGRVEGVEGFSKLQPKITYKRLKLR